MKPLLARKNATARGGTTNCRRALANRSQKTEKTMTRVKLLSAAAALAVILPFATAGSSFAGPGPCTPAGGSVVGSAGPAMSGGQLMAGVGQCRRISSGMQAPAYRGSWGGGYHGGAGEACYHGQPDVYGYGANY